MLIAEAFRVTRLFLENISALVSPSGRALSSALRDMLGVPHYLDNLDFCIFAIG